ncbi:hypothetical protein N7530_013003 [Penicillium desertorum]|uniref:Uncharacterized protein n=1 Tax=Penicillium desertorum TaxID=1303715 RepID=A0A9W9WD01_9EURO|nr:hypothetical protein N7530_013003 [Penicillium desertorum]
MRPAPTGQYARPDPPPRPRSPRRRRPQPPMQGACSIRPPTKAPGPWPPGKVAPFDPPFPPKPFGELAGPAESPILLARSRGPLHRPPWGGSPPPPPSKAEGAPRACTPGLAPRAPASPPLHFTCPPPRPPVRPTPPPRQLAPHAPFPGPRSPRPPSPGAGGGGPPVAHGYVGTGVPGGRSARVTLPGPPP